MKRLTLMSVLFLTACGTNKTLIKSEFLRPQIPAPLLQKVVVTCEPGETSRSLGECALAQKQGLAQANSQIAAIAEVLQ